MKEFCFVKKTYGSDGQKDRAEHRIKQVSRAGGDTAAVWNFKTARNVGDYLLALQSYEQYRINQTGCSSWG
jgi:hypothetical protein